MINYIKKYEESKSHIRTTDTHRAHASLPLMSHPQQRRSPAEVTPHVWYSPALMLAQSRPDGRPLTREWPSCPQQCPSPSRVTPQVWR